MYFPSKLNRADGPTRDSVPEPPDIPLPPWWFAASQGDFEELDRWIEEVEKAVFTADVTAAELLTPVRPEMKSGSKLFSRLRDKQLCKTIPLNVEGGDL